jgi:Tfp pilus assembly protein PilX
MKLIQSIRDGVRVGNLNNQSGLILIAALTLLAALALVGATAYLVSSTDVKLGGNYKTGQIALQVAMAGTEQARETLRALNAASTNTTVFSEELSARVGANAVLNGYTTSTDDSPLASSSSLVSGYKFTAYLTNDSTEGSSNTTDTDGKVVITSVATGPNNTKAIVQTVVKLYTGISSPAAIYSKGDVTGNGSSLTVNGNDECGVESAVAPIYTMSPAVTNMNGNPTLAGSPSTPQTGNLDIGIQVMIDALKGSAAYTLTEDTNNATYGSSTSYKTVYSNTSSPPNVNGLKLNNVTGHGLLLIEGDLVLGGGFTWYGPILVTGSVTLNGGGGGINIHGQILSGTSTLTDVTINGGNVINYNSCEIKKAFANEPLTVVNWKQNLY